MGNWGAVFWCLLKCGQRRRPVAFLAVAPNSPKWKKKCKCKLKFDPKIQKCKYLFNNIVCVLLSYIWIAPSHPYSRWHKCPRWHKILSYVAQMQTGVYTKMCEPSQSRWPSATNTRSRNAYCRPWVSTTSSWATCTCLVLLFQKIFGYNALHYTLQWYHRQVLK